LKLNIIWINSNTAKIKTIKIFLKKRLV